MSKLLIGAAIAALTIGHAWAQAGYGGPYQSWSGGPIPGQNGQYGSTHAACN